MSISKLKTYDVSGIKVEVEALKNWVEARVVEGNHRIKLAYGATIPFAGRHHCSIAVAEPLIPGNVYAAMLEAAKQHVNISIP